MEQPEFKAAVLDASRRLLLEQGFEQVSMRKIAAAVGCKASTLYYYFKNKEEIVAALIEEGMRLQRHVFREIARKHAHPLQRFEALMWTALEFGLNNRALFEILFAAPASGGDGSMPEVRPVADQSLVVETLRECAAQGLVQVEDPALAVATSFAMINGVVYSLLHGLTPAEIPPDRIKRDAIRRVMSGLRG